MSAILDRVNRPKQPFRPQSEPEFFALQLARRIGAEAAECVTLVERNPRESIVRAYRRTLGSHPTATRFRARFLELLRSGNGSAVRRVERTLAAFKVERREIAATVFRETRIEHTQLRQLSSNSRKADAGGLGFVHWIVDQFQTDAAALEAIPEFRGTRRGRLTGLAVDSLRERGVSLWLPRKTDLFAAFGIPPVKTRKEIRRVIRSVWPILNGSTRDLPVLDAAAIGLFVQTERIFHP